MRSLRIIQHISLDGIIQVSGEPGDPFLYGDWTAPYRTPEGRDVVLSLHGEQFDLLLGRRTYDAWASWWPKAPRSLMADRLNAATKYVVTHRTDDLSWGPCVALDAGMLRAVEQLKSEDGPPLILSGSISLCTPLIEAGLADEMTLIVYPVLLGAGKPLLAQGARARGFTLRDSMALPSGLVISRYQLADALPVG